MLDAAELVSRIGYQKGQSYHWPYHEQAFRDAVDAVMVVDAGYQWFHWWGALIAERQKAITQNLDIPDEEWIDRGLPPSLDPYPALRQAVAMVWPTF